MAKASKRIYVLLSNDLFTDQRVHKVCMYLVSKGFEPYLLGRELESSKPIDNRPYQHKRFKLWFNKGALFYANLNIRLFTFLLFKKTPWILANDLDTLPAGYFISKLHRKTRLVYDTHEFYTGVPELMNRPGVRRIWEAIEGIIFPRLSKIYTVNSSIANKYLSLYGKKLEVLRNVAPLNESFQTPLLQELGIDSDDFIVLLQGAGINVDRGGEELVAAMKRVEGAKLLILGDGDAIPTIKEYVEKEGLGEKVLFGPKMAYQDMMNWTHFAKIGCSLDKPDNPNYEMSLPNKVFDYLQAETPVLASPVKEIKALLDEYPFGVCISKVEPEIIADALNELIKNPSILEQYKENCKRFKQTLTWEEEVKVLDKIYVD